MTAQLMALAIATALASTSGSALNDLPLRNLDGAPIRIAELRGRVVLIDVWATWCAPCLADLPLMRELHARHGDRLAIVGISLDRMPRRDFVSWLRRHDVRWAQHFDGRGYASPVARALGVESLPATVLIAADGSMAARNLRGHRLVEAIARLTGEASAGAKEVRR